MARPLISWLRVGSVPAILLALGGVACAPLVVQMLIVVAMALAW